MNILSQTPVRPTFYEVAFLQSAQEVQDMDRILDSTESDSLVCDLLISQYDYLNEQPHREPMTFGQFWLPSYQTVYETRSYLVVRDRFGNYAIYKKAY